MIVVRSVIRAKFGEGGRLAGQAVLAMEQMQTVLGSTCPGWRVLTDLSGEFDTVTLETEVKSLAEWEKIRAAMFADEEFAGAMKAISRLSNSGSQSFLNIESQG